MLRPLFLLGACLLLAASGRADGLADRTLVVVNEQDPASVALGDFYAAQRGIPPANVIALPLPAEETIPWRVFVDTLWQPLQDELLRRGWIAGTAGTARDVLGRRRFAGISHRIAYLVTCRGVPLRISHDPALPAPAGAAAQQEQFRYNQGAVDSELSLLAAGNYDPTGYLPNPWFDTRHPIEADTALVIKVARLDGPTPEDARNLVRSALAGERDGLIGRYYVDLGGPVPEGDRWLEAAGRVADELGYDGDVDRSPGTLDAAARADEAAWYFGWYAPDLDGPLARPDFRFSPGAIALHIHSFSAETLRSPTRGWAGPLVARGAAATFGNVFEPYLQLTERPDLLMQALARGESLGDAAYFALPALSWQGIILGDPLYQPFRAGPAEQQAHRAGLDPGRAAALTVRLARLAERAGHPDEAEALFAAQAEVLPVAVARARWLLERHHQPEAAACLAFVAARTGFETAAWPVAREAALLLGRAGDAARQLQVFDALAASAAPTAAARVALLLEARQAAEAAGDAGRVANYTRQLAAPPVR